MKSLLIVAALSFGVTSSRVLAEETSLDPHLEPLRPLLEMTWRAEFENSKPDAPVVDVSRWERALNGKAVRVLHSINDGIYGGETIFRWDPEKKVVTYHYFTTASFTTIGTVEFVDGKMKTHEVVQGNAGEVTEIRGTSEVFPSGEFKVQTEQLKDGKWVPGRTTTYKKAPDAKVIFK